MTHSFFASNILFAPDSNKCVALLTLNLSAAFDTVDHEILLERTSSKFGIKDKVFAWFKLYLSDRTQFVNNNGAKSDVHSASCGAPQGSVLSSILNLLCMSPLGDILRIYNISFHFYADDSELYTTFSNSIEVHQDKTIRQIETSIVDIENWMTLNKQLKLNSDKTELVIFYPKHCQLLKPLAVSVGSEIIKRGNSIKTLVLLLTCV